jgi:predicted nucleic acid-binding protein
LDGTERVLVDTNVLVYAYDPRDRRKQDVARSVLRELIMSDRAVVSAQCLSEFFSVSTTRLPEPLTRSEARTRVDSIASSSTVLDVTDAVVLEACRASTDHGLSIWDALIWSAAKLNQIRYVLTEDAPHGQRLEAVTFLDPFDATFALPA